MTATKQHKKVIFVGDGAEKTHELLGSHSHARYDKDYCISAAGLLPIAEKKLAAGEKEDVAYFEPFYLKDFLILKKAGAP